MNNLKGGGCAQQTTENVAEAHYHTVHVSSMLHIESSCETSAHEGRSKKSSLEVVHRHSPCKQDTKEPTLAEILAADQSRVNSIHGRRAFNAGINRFRNSKANLPAKPGVSIGTGNYVVNVGLGTPEKTLTLVFDTGSDLTWTQCQPCAKSCYPQQDPIFDPSKSTSYSNITCGSAQCSGLLSATGNKPGCIASTSTCVYGIQYGDQSFSVGYFSKDKITLTPTDSFDNFLFGCGQNNQGLFGKSAGLLGLGRDPLSIVSQTSQKYGKFFSYCLPNKSGSKGHLTFGKDRVPRNVGYTPLTNTDQGTFYFVDLVAIAVGGQQLPISPSIFKNAGTIVDSGTVITRLPPTAYTSMKTAFKKQMSMYPEAPAVSILDTCFDLSNYTSVTIPKLVFIFGGNSKVDLPAPNIFVAARQSILCLAFAGNGDDSDVGIYGNIQQQTFEVVYDVAGGKLGFGPGGCS